MIHARYCWCVRRPVQTTLFALLCVTSAHALPVDTGPGAESGGATLYDDRPFTAGYQSLAGRFTLDAPDTVTSVQGWMNWDGARIIFTVAADFAGLPGARLHSVTLLLPATTVNIPDWRGVGGLNWQLQAGDYWLVFEDARGAGSGSLPGGAAAPLAGYASSPGVLGTEWMRADPLNFGVRINVFPEPPPAPVPTPAGWLLMGSALAAMRLASRRHAGVLPAATSQAQAFVSVPVENRFGSHR